MISIEKYDERSPKLNEDYFNALSIAEKAKYLYRLQKYYTALGLYIFEKLGIGEIENLFQDVKHYPKVATEDMDLYQFLSSRVMKYIYIRNNVYIERLNSEELQRLDSITDNNYKENMDFIESSYKKVINDFPDNPDLSINYGPNNFDYFANTCSLVLGVRVGDECDDNLDMSHEVDEELEFLKTFLSVKGQKVLHIPIKVNRYSQYNIHHK